MTTSATLTPADVTGSTILEAARALAPTIRDASDEIERDRRLPLSLVQAMKQAGIFRMPMPRAWGGPEVDLLTQIEIIEALSMADASVGWCAMIGSDGGFFTAFLDDATGRELYPDLDAVTGSSNRTSGRARVVDGGYEVSGRWAFSSGCQHSTWLLANCVVFDGDRPRLTEDGSPETRRCYLPAERCEIVDTWTTTGLRGTGSHDFTCDAVFVPAERTFNIDTSPIQRSGPLYQFPWMFIANLPGVPLGVARAAIDALLEVAVSKRTPAGTGLRDEAHVQMAVARAETLLGGARGYVFNVLGEVWETLVRGDEVTPTQRARLRLSLAACSQACVEAVDLMYHAAGGFSVYAAGPLDRLFRDAHSVHQHIIHSPKVYEAAGRVLLGLEPGVPSF